MTTYDVPHPPIVSREQWLGERKKLLAQEKELTRQYDRVNYDFHVTNNEKIAPVEYNYRNKAELEANKVPNAIVGEEHGLSVFFRIGDDVFHTYSAYARGTEALTDSRALLDMTPYGRQQDFEDSPPGWPQKPTYG